MKTMFMNATEPKDHKKNLQIDFAPMVDLAFLLITFFVFTTELSKPKALGLHVPDDSDSTVITETIHSATITLLMKENGVIEYFEGREAAPIQTGSAFLYSKPSLRDHLIDKRNRIIQQHNTDSNYTVLIKPSYITSYKEMIDIMDEMKINDIKKFMLLDADVAKH